MPSSRPTSEEVTDYIKSSFVAVSAIGANDLVATPGVGFKLVVYGYCINALAGANTVQFGQGVGIPINGNKALADKATIPMPPGYLPLFECPENTKLVVLLGSATAVSVDFNYMIQRV
jgi:hypothetical protein